MFVFGGRGQGIRGQENRLVGESSENMWVKVDGITSSRGEGGGGGGGNIDNIVLY